MNREGPNPFVTPDKFTEQELPVAELIQRRRLQMLIHSCIYYELGNNIISDKTFDTLGKELVQLQQDYPDIASKVVYTEAFKDWDATTGAFLPLKDEWVVQSAKRLLNDIGGSNKNEHKKILQEPGKKSSKQTERKSLF